MYGDIGYDKHDVPSIFGREIDCDRASCVITENLFNALCQVASSNSAHYLWADALCIDQSNLREKASQIFMMGDIFARASRVIAWLGDDELDGCNFAQIHKKLLNALNKFEAEHGARSIQGKIRLILSFSRE